MKYRVVIEEVTERDNDTKSDSFKDVYSQVFENFDLREVVEFLNISPIEKLRKTQQLTTTPFGACDKSRCVPFNQCDWCRKAQIGGVAGSPGPRC